MTFTDKTPNSFTLENQAGNSQEYVMPLKFNNWQLLEMTGLVGTVLEECSEAGSAIATTIMSIWARSDSNSAKIDPLKAIKQIEDAIGESFLSGTMKGAGELFKAIKKHKVFQAATAIMFLKPGEDAISEEDMPERISQMNGVPFNKAWEALRYFFTTRAKSSSDSNSPLAITETTKKKNSQTK